MIRPMNMIFNASAGTGKTWQVTELYCALVLGTEMEHLPAGRAPVPPEKILLMTFTDNAAAELRERVSAKMIAVEKEGDEDASDRARAVLRNLPASNISTIHAFCAGLLREHALELGLSPVFQTLEEEERDTLLEETLKTGIFQTLETDPGFREFCGGVSILGDHDYSVLSTVRSLLEKADSRGLNLAAAESMLPPVKQTVGREDFQRIYDRLAEIDADRGLPARAARNFQTLELFLADFPNIGKAGELTKFTGKDMKPISDELAELKERYTVETLYAEHRSMFCSFARCLARCASGFAAAKRARDCVDFGDQLLLARDLLKAGPYEEPPFEWIIVDEVQDTSRVQCDVIESLWMKGVNLVVCGDKKQSIYAWRSADPNVMPDLKNWMDERGDCRQINLKTSYRSKERVIAAVNDLFEGVYESYDALEAREELQGEGPCVEFLEADDDGQGSEEEMAAVARRIRLLVDGGGDWRPVFGHDGAEFAEGQPVGYGDILILLKRSTHQGLLENALRAAGIPYSSGGKGKALFEQQEVRDLLLFLQAVTQPQNDLALVGFLRSPFVSLPDDEIVRLGWDGKTFDREILRKQFLRKQRRDEVDDGVSPPIPLVSENDEIIGLTPQPRGAQRVREAAEMLMRYRAAAGSCLPSQLVRDAVRETAFDAQLAGQPGGEQKLANFKKALDWIRAVERGGQVLIGDVVRRFEKAIRTPPRSGAAEALLPDPDQNTVTIMTVHGAKGLTKRVCFVPDISFGEVSEPGFAMISPEGTLELSLSDLTGGKVVSPGWKAAREADKRVRAVESTNVFYVAMTRARDLVVMSGCGTRRSKGWKKQADVFLSGAAPEVLRTLRFADVPPVEIDRKLDDEDLQPEVEFKPLKVSAGMERKAVTSLVEKKPSRSPNGEAVGGDRREFGTLGHTVLEELAKNGWAGDVAELLRQFSATEYDGLAGQLEAARRVLRQETAGAETLLTEHSFVLRRGDVILDGTIDLLARFPHGWKILDYKFSNEAPAAALETYRPQLAAYREAVEKLNPGAEVSAALVLIGRVVQVVDGGGGL